jgi:hypothetical protein
LREEALVLADGFCYDYNRHFAFGIENLGENAVPVEVFINCSGDSVLPAYEASLYCADSPSAEFKRTELESKTDRRKVYYVKLGVESRRAVYIANYYFRQYEKLVKIFDGLAERGGAVRDVFGQTVEGRELVCYRYAAGAEYGVQRPSVLITSGMHPPESDTIASEAIMEFLVKEGAEFGRHFDLYIVPIANPDGFVHGYNGCNASQVNFFWQFDENDQRRCPEAYFLWGLISRIKPVVYIDFHGYTFQLDGRQASPYVKPAIFYEGRAVRRLVRTLNRDVLSLSDGYATRGILTYAPSTLASKITRAFNTITYAKYHLHLRDGIQTNRELAVAVLTRILDGLRALGFTDPGRILKSPHGNVSRDYWSRGGRALAVFWGLNLRPRLGAVKRSFLRGDRAG